MGIIYELWELPKLPQKKIMGVGYSSVYLTNEDKGALSYKMWRKMIHLCYGIGEEYNQKRKGLRFECCNSWLDYQNFLRWFNKNYRKGKECSMTLTKCVISKGNTIYNPNNCAIVPKEIAVFLECEDFNIDKGRKLAKTYKDYITDDIYDLLTEEY